MKPFFDVILHFCFQPVTPPYRLWNQDLENGTEKWTLPNLTPKCTHFSILQLIRRLGANFNFLFLVLDQIHLQSVISGKSSPFALLTKLWRNSSGFFKHINLAFCIDMADPLKWKGNVAKEGCGNGQMSVMLLPRGGGRAGKLGVCYRDGISVISTWSPIILIQSISDLSVPPLQADEFLVTTKKLSPWQN